jgi:NAD(P)-dependent dehydrogenase (short-subunit alcohol dehydrogenase family)
MSQVFDLTGKRILVTGASSGIGRASAILFAKQGADLILVGRHQETLEETRLLTGSPERHAVITLDLSCVERLDEILSAFDFKSKKINGLFYAAGITDIVPLGMATYKSASLLFNVNFFAYIELCRLLCKKSSCHDQASFVAVSSAASQRVWKGGLAYSSSKAALEAATKVLALEFAQRRIRFNTIVPSYIRTRMVEETEAAGISVADIVQQTQPLGLGEPEDVANAALFLLSDASRFVTGTGMVVDGGALA